MSALSSDETSLLSILSCCLDQFETKAGNKVVGCVIDLPGGRVFEWNGERFIETKQEATV